MDSCRLHTLLRDGISPYTQLLGFGIGGIGFCCHAERFKSFAFVVPGSDIIGI